MLEVIFSLVILFLSTVGLIEIFRIIFVSLNKSELNKNIITLLPIYGHVEDIEMLLRSAKYDEINFDSKNNRHIMCLDLGMDDETRRICEIFSQENENIDLCSLKEFNDIMEQATVYLR